MVHILPCLTTVALEAFPANVVAEGSPKALFSDYSGDRFAPM
jgi:hypothetical protein